MVVLAGVRPAAAAPRSIAVVIQLAVNVSDGDADAIAADLAASIVRVTGVPAVGGAAIRARAGAVSEDCLATPECVTALAARLEVDGLVTALVVRVGDELQLDVALIDAASGAEASRARIQIGARDPLADRLDGISATLLPPVATRPPDEVAPAPIAPPPPRGRRITTATWIAGGVGLAALAGAAGFGWSARQQFLDCEDRGDCDAGERDRIASHALVADVALGVGVVAVGVAAWRYLGSRAAAPSADVTARPVQGGAVVGVAGRF